MERPFGRLLTYSGNFWMGILPTQLVLGYALAVLLFLIPTYLSFSGLVHLCILHHRPGVL